MKTTKKIFRRIGNLGIPSSIKRGFYKRCGYKIGKGVKIHRTARISAENFSIQDHSEIGEDVLIIGLKKVKIGEFTTISRKVSIEGDSNVEIGDNCFIGINSIINARAPVKISDNVALGGYYTQIWTHSTWPEEIQGFTLNKIRRVNIKKNVYIGAGSIILPGVDILENSIIGAGSIVTKKVDKNSLYFGSPAKKISNVSKYKKKIDKEKLVKDFFIGKKEYALVNNLSKKDYERMIDAGIKVILVLNRIEKGFMKKSKISIFDFKNNNVVVKNKEGVEIRKEMNDFFARFKKV